MLALHLSQLLIRRLTWAHYLSDFIEESEFSRLPPALPPRLTITGEGSWRKWGSEEDPVPFSVCLGCLKNNHIRISLENKILTRIWLCNFRQSCAFSECFLLHSPQRRFLTLAGDWLGYWISFPFHQGTPKSKTRLHPRVFKRQSHCYVNTSVQSEFPHFLSTIQAEYFKLRCSLGPANSSPWAQALSFQVVHLSDYYTNIPQSSFWGHKDWYLLYARLWEYKSE